MFGLLKTHDLAHRRDRLLLPDWEMLTRVDTSMAGYERYTREAILEVAREDVHAQPEVASLAFGRGEFICGHPHRLIPLLHLLKPITNTPDGENISYLPGCDQYFSQLLILPSFRTSTG